MPRFSLPRLKASARAALLTLIVCVPLSGFATQTAQPLSAAERRQILAALAGAPDHGLPSAQGADSDAQLLAAAVDYAAMHHGGRVTPRRVDSFWGVAPEPAPTAADLNAARARGELAQWLAALPVQSPSYRLLVAQRRRYAQLAVDGGWPPMAGGKTLRYGDTDPRVAVLRRRLTIEGYGSSDAGDATLFDAPLAAALSRFQAARGLEIDGVLGPESIAVLNVTAEQRLAQIDANLERWRWLPRALPAERIEVDVAGMEASYFVAGQPALRMNIVVGDPRHHTPLFYSAVSSIVFNPPWNVPASIARNELLPRAARDPGYLARNNFRYVDGRLQQAPGPGSALGVLKFDFPSPYGVYLHDTPGKAAFAQRNRALSHGCMRLEKPRELAVLLLGRQGWTAAQVEQAIAARATRRVDLERTVPLFVTYRTAVGLGDGSAVFRTDIYGWDAKLTAALGAQRLVVAQVAPPESECSGSLSA